MCAIGDQARFGQANRMLCQIQGAYAEYIVVSEKELLPKPAHLSWVDAASIPEVWITGTECTLPRVFQVEAYRPWLERSASCIG